MFETITKKIPATLLSKRERAARECMLENKHEVDNKIHFNPYVNQEIEKFKAAGGLFNRFALAESAVRALLFNLFEEPKDNYDIIEFGGGQSTLFFNQIASQMPITLYSYEHDYDWYHQLKEKTEGQSGIHLRHAPLYQITDQERAHLMSHAQDAYELWQDKAVPASESDIKNTRAKNCFYNVEPSQFPSFDKADAIIIDGPHGNGRSMSYSVFHQYFAKGTLVLVDDYHHYPFLEELQGLHDIEILADKRYQHSNKGWILGRVRELG